MLCERCKIREANIKYTEIINGVKTEHNLCSQCAREMDFGQYSSIFEGDFPFGKLLSGLLGLGENTSSREQEMRQITCPTCGLTYEEFLKKSRFGCADCYQVFDLLITDNIKKLQGSENHKGKIPKMRSRSAGFGAESGEDAGMEDMPKAAPAGTQEDGDDTESRLMRLRRQLEAAVKNEEYETAARLRDEIRAIKEEIKTDE